MKQFIMALALALTAVTAQAETQPPRTVVMRVNQQDGSVSVHHASESLNANDAASVIGRDFQTVTPANELDRDSSNSGWYYYYGAWNYVAPAYYYQGGYHYYAYYYTYLYSYYAYYFYRW